ncbi:VC_2705 family sodium/solute symporter [Hydrogenobacter sp. T-2]|uniref:sodium:solute symporter family protein n=1 Tax=Pampinifervens diazotrophicum TaxID=1632018 RepID=UPI002B258A66|nr:VC_2705 family sodium/solute symporter [Hydrogenobacter sp. T-2]WPM32244.1 VC_2705 family sodium/solute symporter [Hydrogenobacter sp. T-2]
MVDRNFIERLRKVYAIYTGGLILLLILLYIGEKFFGLSPTFIGYVFLFGTIAVYAAIGIISRTGQVAEYYVAGRRVPAVFNGMATAADWMSAASFIGMAGALALQGYNGLAFIMGWTGGYVLLGVLIAPYLRKFGAYTIPDFLDARYGGKFPRFVGIVATLIVSFTYLVAQITGVGIIASRLLGLPFEVGVFVGLVGILVCSFLGGMKAVTWTQVAQYIVLIIAYLIPVTVLSYKYTGNPISQVSYGFALQGIEQKFAQLREDPKEQEVREIWKKRAEELKAKIETLPQSWEQGKRELEEKLRALPADDPQRAEIEKQLKEYPKSPEEAKEKWTDAMKKATEASKPPKSYITPPSDAKGMANFLALTLMLMLGTAGLPHVIMRFYTTPTVREARTSAGWALFFILLLYITAPAYAAFGRYEMLNLVGKAFSELPDWVQKWAKVNLITIRDLNGDGIVQFAEISIHPDMIVLATPEIAGLPYVIAGFVAAGGLAAALSTADGLLITISNAISHDLYYKMINPNLSPSTRVKIGKALLLVVALIGAYVASFRLAIIVELVAWAFSLAAASLFPALVLGIWDKRMNKQGAIAGMIVGLTATIIYLYLSRFKGIELFGIKPIASGIFGMPLNFLVALVVSRLTPPPPQKLQEFVDSIRYPKGAVKAGAQE